MTDAKELDRLDLLVAEAIGELTGCENYKGVPVYKINGVEYLDWSPTQNAVHRDMVVNWLWKTEGVQVTIDYFPNNQGDGHAPNCVATIYHAESNTTYGGRVDLITPGESLCRAVEQYIKQ